jgi:tRNA(His) 5'-end guanylyltransferase
MEDALGDRMKLYEGLTTPHRLLPMLPVVARIDGRSFHTFTKGLQRPYDPGLSRLMVETTRYLVEETNARIGYTQSDEINLVLYSDDHESKIYFDGRLQKLVSQLAAQATAAFNFLLPTHLPEKAAQRGLHNLPSFDARVFVVPSLTEAANAILWRELDASKNSVSMAARAYYSHGELLGKNSSEMQEMLFQKGVNWDSYPAFFKRGTYIRRRAVRRKFSVEELAALPPLHNAHKNPDLEIERSEIAEIELPPLNRVTNREQVLFFGADPQRAEAA